MPTTLRDGSTTDDPRLGRVAPQDWQHVDKYPLQAANLRALREPVPVIVGTNWYSGMYASGLVQRRGKNGRMEWWIPENLGRLVGGHAYVLEPPRGPCRDTDPWWAWHDQVSEGICVSEACARLAALLNRRRYQPRPLYDAAQLIDEWEGIDYSGTSVNAGLAIMRGQGLVPSLGREKHYVGRGEVTRPFKPEHGILENRWARSIDDVFAALGIPDAQSAVLLNSWGRNAYPHRVRIARTTLARLREEGGEMGIVTDRP